LATAGAETINARSNGDGQFTPGYLPPGVEISSRYDTEIAAVDSSGMIGPEAMTLGAHVLELTGTSGANKSVSITVTTIYGVATSEYPGTTIRLRGQPASLRLGPLGPQSLLLRWTERDGVEVQLLATGVSEDETIAFAMGLVEGV